MIGFGASLHMNLGAFSTSVRAMTKHDSKWYDKVTTIQPQNHVAKAGTPCDHFLLKPPHPLHTSHILVPRVKLGIPAFAGAPPPSDPSSPLDTEEETICRILHEQIFHLQNFT
jgi:hypothetical protein